MKRKYVATAYVGHGDRTCGAWRPHMWSMATARVATTIWRYMPILVY